MSEPPKNLFEQIRLAGGDPYKMLRETTIKESTPTTIGFDGYDLFVAEKFKTEIWPAERVYQLAVYGLLVVEMRRLAENPDVNERQPDRVERHHLAAFLGRLVPVNERR